MNRTQRKHGRMIFKTESNEDKLHAFEWIVSNSSFAIIDGVTVDAFSASAVLTLYEALNKEVKNRLLSYSIPRIVKVAYTILNKYS